MTASVQARVAEVARFFRRYGWRFDMLDDETFRTIFRGRVAAFVALVRVTEHWVVLTVNPFVRPPGAGFGAVALRLLASANHQENIVKLGLDDDDDVFVNVELPTEELGYEEFSAALTALSHSADRLIVPLLQAMAIDERNTA
ncbi:MAG: hypothetical protein FJ137_23195 [Deltaproteobacteria bacterium]|nr:hypothetical protein [Deltaproteobacteria bacterium]